MASIIVLENGASLDNLSKVVDSAATSLAANVTVIHSTDKKFGTHAASIDLRSDSASETIWNTLKSSNNEEVLLLVDARSQMNTEQLNQQLLQFGDSDADYQLLGISSDAESAEIEELCAHSLVAQINPNGSIPRAAIMLSGEAVARIDAFEVVNTEDFIAQLFISMLGIADLIGQESDTVTVAGAPSNSLTTLSGTQCARILRHAVNSINIEELFPNHAWAEHGNESAAAAYHSLAAAFINLGDHDSALECLALSDQLEDSPRSLALRGIIATMKGETLQAVANMVSSLQEYEKRKNPEEGQHYLSFQPRDLEKINTDLQSGLDALNKRDNDSALDFFSDAVFQFDSFYEDLGLKKPQTH